MASIIWAWASKWLQVSLNKLTSTVDNWSHQVLYCKLCPYICNDLICVCVCLWFESEHATVWSGYRQQIKRMCVSSHWKIYRMNVMKDYISDTKVSISLTLKYVKHKHSGQETCSFCGPVLHILNKTDDSAWLTVLIDLTWPLKIQFDPCGHNLDHLKIVTISKVYMEYSVT